jgi:CRISPR-associated endonuclease Cas1
MKLPIWAPYTQKIEAKKNGKLYIKYNGGEVEEDLKKVHSIMLYGDVDEDISPKTLEVLALSGIPLIIHKRNMNISSLVLPSTRAMREDVLTAQILCRNDERKSKYIARELLKAKFKSMEWLLPVSPALNPRWSIKQMRNIEAHHSRAYWKVYYSKLEQEGSRRTHGNLKKSLDAVSKFVSGVILRWISYHHLSPFHGFLHESTEYSSLVYDLIEPFRGFIDKEVFSVALENPEDKWLPYSIEGLKGGLKEIVYCPQTRQEVSRQELMHGVILALRAYLTGLGKRFIIPTEGLKKGGRPMKTNFRLPGRMAGRSNIYR